MLKTLGAQIKEFKKDSFLTPVFMILEVLMETVIPLMMASIIDNGVEKGDIHHIYVMGGLMIVTACVSLFAGVMGGKYGARASTGFARNLRKAMYENIQTFSFSNIDKFSTAGLVTRLTTDVTNIQMAYQMILRMCVRAPITLVCAMIMAFFINAKLACIYLAAVILLGIILAFITVRAHKYFTQVFPKYDDLNASVQENVSAIRVVKAYVREDFEKDRFKKASENIYRIFVKAERNVIFNAPLMMTTVYTCIILISWLGAKMITSSTLTTGELMSLLAYCMNILSSLMMLSMVFVMISMSTASMQRISEVLNEESDLHNPADPVFEVKDGRIEFKNVEFAYKKDSKEPVLTDINLKIRSGETIGIIGGTGSAKTSLVNLVSRLYDVTKGEVLVGGRNVREYDMESLRNQVAVVLQKNVLFSGTILENLRWGNKNATDEELKKYSEKLSKRKQIIVANKADSMQNENLYLELEKLAKEKGLEIYKISAATKQGVKELLTRVSEVLKTLPKEEIVEEEDKVIYTLDDDKEEFTVRKDGDTFVVEGKAVNRLMGRINIDDNESMYYFQKKLKELGIEDELKRQGICEGDYVKMLNWTFEWYQ